MLNWLSVDGKKLLLTRVLRTFAYGYLTVILGVYLDSLGMDPTEIGFILAAAIAGSALMTVFWSLVADRIGRRRTVATMAGLMAVGGLLFAFAGNFVPLLIGAFTGTISATSSEVGIFQTVEQAILPQTAPDERRTWLFAIYNTVANFAAAFGSLAAAAVGFFTSLGLQGADPYRPFFLFYALVGLVNLAVFVTLSDKVEVAKVHGERRFLGITRSGGTVAKLSADCSRQTPYSDDSKSAGNSPPAKSSRAIDSTGSANASTIALTSSVVRSTENWPANGAAA